MRNNECSVWIGTGHGRTWVYRRDKDGWTQTGPTGSVRRLTAEQLLSHILPPLAARNRSHVSVKVIPDTAPGGRRRTTRRVNLRQSGALPRMAPGSSASAS